LYNLVFSEETRKVIALPAPALFDVNARNGYTITPEEITAYEGTLAAVASEAQPWDARVPQPRQFLPGPEGFYEW
jgi:hypothetical protein